MAPPDTLRHADHELLVDAAGEDGWLVRLEAGGEAREFRRAADYFLDLWEGQIPLFVEAAGERRRVRIAFRLLDRTGGVLRMKLVPADAGERPT